MASDIASIHGPLKLVKCRRKGIHRIVREDDLAGNPEAGTWSGIEEYCAFGSKEV